MYTQNTKLGEASGLHNICVARHIDSSITATTTEYPTQTRCRRGDESCSARSLRSPPLREYYSSLLRTTTTMYSNGDDDIDGTNFSWMEFLASIVFDFMVRLRSSQQPCLFFNFSGNTTFERTQR
uniref:Uncharacterized protein n=1 Tax=Steinernema glaseri TaxID=37863 RepID=A0A1I7ZRN2_9BILA